jgi:hypothetical protein
LPDAHPSTIRDLFDATGLPGKRHRTMSQHQRQNGASRIMMGIGTPSSQSKMERPMSFSFVQ